MSERLVGEIAFDMNYREFYLAVREEKLEDGGTFGVIVAYGDSEEEVRMAIENDPAGTERYHLFKPVFYNGDRLGEIIGGSE